MGLWSTTALAGRRGTRPASAPWAGRGWGLTLVLVVVAATVAALTGTAVPEEAGFRFTFVNGGIERPAQAVAATTAPGVGSLSVAADAGQEVSEIGLTFAARAGERFYGLGERFERLELTGPVVDVWTEDRAIQPKRRTSYAPSPFSSPAGGMAFSSTLAPIPAVVLLAAAAGFVIVGTVAVALLRGGSGIHKPR